MRANRPCAPSTQRGAAALIVVVVLFFILAMVTAYAGRNLIFEQRTSINNQRATQAFEAAEAGLEFAVSQLSGGRTDAVCAPTTDTTQATFRDRHLTQGANGLFTLTGSQATLKPACMLLTGGPTCSCPAATAPALAEPVGLTPAFQLRFDPTAQPGVVRVTSTGCSSIGTQCYGASTKGQADAVAETSVLLALNSALARPPAAAITARGTVEINHHTVTISNDDVPSSGVTIDAGGPIQHTDYARLLSIPGSPGPNSLRANDPSLSAMTPDRMFLSTFGMDRATYRSQPAVVRVTCNGACDAAIAGAVSANPGRIVWVEGSATIDNNLVLGSTATPVMLVLQGDLTVAANLNMVGMLYLHAQSGSNVWNTTAGSTLIEGAVVTEGNLTFNGAPAIRFDPNVLRTISTKQGSMVRVPGSWRDFQAGS
jgi:hypothetical protein